MWLVMTRWYARGPMSLKRLSFEFMWSPMVVFRHIVNGGHPLPFLWLWKGWQQKRRPPTNTFYIYTNIGKGWNQPAVLYSVQPHPTFGIFSWAPISVVLVSGVSWTFTTYRPGVSNRLTFAQQNLSMDNIPSKPQFLSNGKLQNLGEDDLSHRSHLLGVLKNFKMVTLFAPKGVSPLNLVNPCQPDMP